MRTRMDKDKLPALLARNRDPIAETVAIHRGFSYIGLRPTLGVRVPSRVQHHTAFTARVQLRFEQESLRILNLDPSAFIAVVGNTIPVSR